MGIFYRPEQSVAGDFIPLYANGRYHLFYLRDWRNEEEHGRGTPWHHLVTDDFVSFEDWGEAIPRGPEGSQDLWVFTGCAIEIDDAYEIYYTGHNSDFAGSDKPQEVILRAHSPDLKVWTKDPEFRLEPAAGYERDDWRDPFVLFDERSGEYAMLLAARRPSGPSRYRGCTALLTSSDRRHWTVREPLWSPNLYFTHECPDVFRVGDWWYLVYSTFSERMVTHYRMSRSLDGPWLAPDAADGGDTFDGRAYYAAKSAADGERRYLFGWLPTRVGDKDDGAYQWGGNLVVHEIVQAPSGALAVRLPDTVARQFAQSIPWSPRIVMGNWSFSPDGLQSSSTDSHAAASLGSLPAACLIELHAAYEPRTTSFGINLHADANLDSYYQVRIEPRAQRIVFDRWPRPGDQPFSIERPVELRAGQAIRLRILVGETCLVAYVNDRVALSSRIYDHTKGEWGVFVVEGRAWFSDLRIATRIEEYKLL